MTNQKQDIQAIVPLVVKNIILICLIIMFSASLFILHIIPQAKLTISSNSNFLTLLIFIQNCTKFILISSAIMLIIYILQKRLSVQIEYKANSLALEESDKKFMDVFMNSNDAILLIDQETFVDCNDVTVKMLQYNNKKELLQTHPSKLSPEYQPDGQTSFDKANEMMSLAVNNGFHSFEWIHTKATGENFPVNVSLTPITLKGKQIIYCVWKDISSQKHAEKIIKENESRLKAIYNASSDGIMVLDEMHFLDCNESALTMFNCPSVLEFCSQHPADLSPATQPDGTNSMSLAKQHIKEALSKGKHCFEWTHKRMDTNECFPAEVSLNIMTLGNKTVLQAVVRDITERKENETKMHNYIDKLNKSNKVMTGRELRIIELKKEISELKESISELKANNQDK